MDTSLYIIKTKEHLADPSTYKELNSDPTQAINNNVLSTPDDKTRHHLMPSKPICTPLFYDLPKVHKVNIPLQPVVLACDSQTGHTQTMLPTSYNFL